MEKCLGYRTPFQEYFERFICWLTAFVDRAVTFLSADGSVSAHAAKQNAVNQEAAHILDEYGNKILRLAYSYLHNMSDAEDVLQDTLIKLLKTAPAFESESHKLAWLLRVAANLSKTGSGTIHSVRLTMWMSWRRPYPPSVERTCPLYGKQ